MENESLRDFVARQYTKLGYKVETRGDYIFLRFSDTAKRPSAVIRCVESDHPLTKQELFSEFTDFEYALDKDNPCFQYRIICPAGFEEKTEVFRNYNVSLSDGSYLKDITQKDYIYLYAHNEVMIENIKRDFEEVDKVAAVQATGSGKSLLIAEMARQNKDMKQLVVVPRRNIIEEVKRQIPSTVKDISFETYQHLCQMTEEELKAIHYDRLYLDEFHHMGAREWSRAVKTMMSVNEHAKVLGTTATVNHVGVAGVKRDMSDLEFDRVAGSLSLEQALVRHVLTSPSYVSMPYSYDDLRDSVKALSKGKDEKVASLLEAIDKQEKEHPVHEIIRENLPKTTGRMLVFCPTVKDLKRYKSAVLNMLRDAKISPAPFEYYHSSNDRKTTKGLEDMLKHRTTKRMQVLFAVDMLNEGVHVPDVTAAIFLRPTDSDTLFKQQLGRLMNAGTTESTVVFDMVDNIYNSHVADIQEGVNREIEAKEQMMRSVIGIYRERHPVEFKVKDYLSPIRAAQREMEPTHRSGVEEKLRQLFETYPVTRYGIRIPVNTTESRKDYEQLYQIVQRALSGALTLKEREAFNQYKDRIDLDMLPLFSMELREMLNVFKRDPTLPIPQVCKRAFKNLSREIIQGNLRFEDLRLLESSGIMRSWMNKLETEAKQIYKSVRSLDRRMFMARMASQSEECKASEIALQEEKEEPSKEKTRRGKRVPSMIVAEKAVRGYKRKVR